uniref:DddA-like double-stranded DNA deaminase toxin n=1 Tax=Streptomyces sp. CC208A TaxID=3044573 RepID=UPI0024A8EB4E
FTMPGVENGTGYLFSGPDNVWGGYDEWIPDAAEEGMEHHLEAQAAGLLARAAANQGSRGLQGFLYLAGNNARFGLCPSCARTIESMLPSGVSLTVVYRNRSGIQRRSYTGS